ncbi:MAG: DUF6175 family protein [Rikenellaceae bacterium]
MKRVVLTLMLALVALAGFSQAKKPSIMVVPSEVWMTRHGYMNEVELNGVKQQIPDYKRALSSNGDLLIAITKFGEMMASRGYPLKDLASVLRSLQTQSTEEMFIGEAEGGVAKSSLDMLRETAKADIEIHLTWLINTQGPKRSLTANFQGIDTYTNKQIAAASGTGNPTSSTEIPVLLSEAVIVNMNKFCAQLEAHFDDLFDNGREISLQCRRTNSSDINFDSEVGGDILNFIIEDWVAANTVQGRFNTTDATENVMNFEQVRIPLEINGRQIDARSWARNLQRELMTKHKIRVKLDTRGLGHAYLLIEGGM